MARAHTYSLIFPRNVRARGTTISPKNKAAAGKYESVCRWRSQEIIQPVGSRTRRVVAVSSPRLTILRKDQKDKDNQYKITLSLYMHMLTNVLHLEYSVPRSQFLIPIWKLRKESSSLHSTATATAKGGKNIWRRMESNHRTQQSISRGRSAHADGESSGLFAVTRWSPHLGLHRLVQDAVALPLSYFSFI